MFAITVNLGANKSFLSLSCPERIEFCYQLIMLLRTCTNYTECSYAPGPGRLIQTLSLKRFWKSKLYMRDYKTVLRLIIYIVVLLNSVDM